MWDFQEQIGHERFLLASLLEAMTGEVLENKTWKGITSQK
jgi:hypothetical protein